MDSAGASPSICAAAGVFFLPLVCGEEMLRIEKGLEIIMTEITLKLEDDQITFLHEM